MRIAFVGKGGSGKTTLTALFTAYLAADRAPVLAIDADINQHLAQALGIPEADARVLPALGEHLPLIKDWLRGSNRRITSPDVMVKTTPPGAGSRLLSVTGDNPVYDACLHEVGGVRLAVTGPFAEDEVGVSCYHGKVGGAELILSHLVDGPDEYVVVDTTAGADSVVSGLFARFDLVVVVVEPTLRSLGVFQQLNEHAAGFGTPLAVVANKVADEADAAFLRRELGKDPLATFAQSSYVRATERGEARPIGDLEPENLTGLKTIKAHLDAIPQDWPAHQARAVELHLRNARAWANDRTGVDLTTQVDPDFVSTPRP